MLLPPSCCCLLTAPRARRTRGWVQRSAPPATPHCPAGGCILAAGAAPLQERDRLWTLLASGQSSLEHRQEGAKLRNIHLNISGKVKTAAERVWYSAAFAHCLLIVLLPSPALGGTSLPAPFAPCHHWGFLIQKLNPFLPASKETSTALKDADRMEEPPCSFLCAPIPSPLSASSHSRCLAFVARFCLSSLRWQARLLALRIP